MSLHFAFFNIPALGHLFPTLGIVAELVRRGHRVSYAAVPERAAYVVAAGAKVMPYRTLRPSDRDPGFEVPDRSEHIGRSLVNFLAETEATLPQLEPAFVADPPDLVLFDRLAFAGGVLAEKHAVPSIQLWPMMVSSKEWSMGSVVPIDGSHPSFAEYRARLEVFLAEQELDVRPEEFLEPRVVHNLAFYPRAFQYSGERFGDRYSFVGPCTAPRAGQVAWQPPPGGRPVMLISLGTLNNRRLDFYRTCFAAFEGSPWHVVLPVGHRFDVAELGPVPANFEVCPEVSQLDVLRYAEVFVSHGGMGGVMEALSEGVPQVILSGTLEQDLNATRVQDLGVGIRLSFVDLTAAVLRETVDRAAADPSIARAVEVLQGEVRAAGGPVRAADVIESCLA